VIEEEGMGKRKTGKRKKERECKG